MRHSDRFTERACGAIKKAHKSAEEFGHSYVGTEHLLMGIANEYDGLGAKALRENGLETAVIAAQVEKLAGRGLPGAPAQGLTPRAKAVIEHAMADSVRLGHNYVGTEHLLMGILREAESTGAKVICSIGMDLNKIYTDIMNIFSTNEPRPRAVQGNTRPNKTTRASTKMLDQYSRDLTEMAYRGQVDPVIGRDKEIQRVIQILSRRSKNNPLLIGEPGVGKTAVAEGLAQLMSVGDVPENIRGKRIMSLDLPTMVAGTKYRGDFEDRIRTMLTEIKNSGDIILFVDELHTIIGAGAAEGAIDAANIMKPALGRSEIQIIGATTLEEYRKHVEKDAALERRFQPVSVNEPTEDESIAIIKGLRDRYEAHHKLKITDEAIEASVKMSVRYINDRYLPDKAIDLVDEAASRVRMERMTAPNELKALEGRLTALSADKEAAVKAQNFEEAANLRNVELEENRRLEELRNNWNFSRAGYSRGVRESDIAAVVSAWTGIPVTTLTEDESSLLMRMEERLHRRVIGQKKAVSSVSRAIRRGRVGLKDPQRPMGSFLFCGPTGVGKTELCKALAEVAFGDENAMIRIDMSELMEKHAMSKLIGSPPGYVGYDEGGQLTEKVRRKPYSLILFDEIEKAHEDIFNIMLQIMEDGRLTDAQGRKVDFKNTIIVMTSNVGAKNITEKQKTMGFSDKEAESGEKEQHKEIHRMINADLKRTFKPEFLNRIDETIVFHRLSKEDIRTIARGMLKTVADRLSVLGVSLEVKEEALDFIADKGYDPVYGARPIRRLIQSEVEDRAAELMLSADVNRGDKVEVTVISGKLVLEKAD